MLYAMLNENFKPDESLPKVFYIQPKAIMKLFRLKVGNERVSSQHIVQRMIRRYVDTNLFITAALLMLQVKLVFRSEVGYVLENKWENMGSLEVAHEHYGQLSWTNPDMIKRIWTRDELWRENISNAILACHAFTDLCLNENNDALRLLWKRGS